MFTEFNGHNRIPAFMGDFNGLFRTALQREVWFDSMSDNILHVYNTGWNTGKVIGYNEGVGVGAKEYIFNGRNQFYISNKTGKVFPFGSIDELLKDKQTLPEISEFVREQSKKEYAVKKKEYHEELNDIEKNYAELHEKALEEDKDYDLSSIMAHLNPVKVSGHKLVADENLKELADEIYETSRLMDNSKRLKNPEPIKRANDKQILKIEREISSIEEKINDIKSNKKTNVNTRPYLNKLNKKATQLSERQDKLKEFIDLNKKIDEYLMLQDGNNKRKQAVSARNKYERSKTFDDPTTSMATRQQIFRGYRPGNMPVLLTDQGTYVNGPAVRKINNPNKKDGLKDAVSTSWTNSDKFDPNIYTDRRTNPTIIERNKDVFNFLEFQRGPLETKDSVMALARRK